MNKQEISSISNANKAHVAVSGQESRRPGEPRKNETAPVDVIRGFLIWFVNAFSINSTEKSSEQ